MDAVDVDVKLVLYNLLARIDDDGSYVGIRQQIDHMYDSDSSESSSEDTDDCDDIADTAMPSTRRNLEELMDLTTSKDVEVADNDDHETEIDGNEQSDPEEEEDADMEDYAPKTKGELGVEDLPPIDQLVITPDGTLEQIGEISAILDKIVVIKAFRFTPALNMDTILFLSNGQSVGPIFETFGPVVEPFYLIRFNSLEEISRLNLVENLGIYFSPHSARYTKYVFVDHLRTVKGSDASWEDNNEPPPECLDFSDDEEERRCKAALESEKRRNHYAHFIPEEKRINQAQGSSNSATSCLPPSVNCDAAMFKSLSTKEIDRKANLKAKLVGAALARARRKAARTNLGDIPSSTQATASNNPNNTNISVLSLVEEAVKTNPSILSSIISSALSAAGNQQPGSFMPMALPVMLPPSAESPSQPRFVPTVPTALPPNLQLPAQNIVTANTNNTTAEPPRRRLMDPRFVKKQS